jgi:thiol-disulfide isomerase/thioredoxin
MTRADLDFTLPAAGGGEISLREISAGRAATVVIFTCNHCPYARAWHDRVQEVARDYIDRVGFVQINPNDATRYPKDSFEMMEERVAAGEFATPYLWDASQEVARAWRPKVTPHVFVVDADGEIVYEGAPDGYHGAPELRQWSGEPGQCLPAAKSVVRVPSPLAARSAGTLRTRNSTKGRRPLSCGERVAHDPAAGVVGVPVAHSRRAGAARHPQRARGG